MPTGTNGPDNLRIDVDSDSTAYGLAGDDVITVSASHGQFRTVDILVDGGADFDTMLTEDFSYIGGTGIPGRIIFEAAIEGGGWLSFTNVERVELNAIRWFRGPGIRENVELITGDSHDRISFNGALMGSGPVWLNLLGGNDEVVLTSAYDGVDIDLGTGDDSVDLSGAVASFVTVDGGDGNDELIGTNNTDVFRGDAGEDVLRGGRGSDRLEGGADNDDLDGGRDNDILDGGAGIDRMAGGLGNDRFFVEAGDILVELAGEGVDVAYARTDYVLNAGAHVDQVNAIDAASTIAIHLTGNELGNVLQGNAGGNRLLGEGGDDYLVGLGGLDVLDGGGGIDTLDGGLGNDRFFVDSGDRILERAGEGSEVAYARTDYVLNAGAHVELLTAISATATDGIDLTGNELGNTIQGNAGANILTGGGGIDHLTGLGGADTFRYVAVSDSPKGAFDRIADFVSGTDKIDLSLIDANSNTAGVDDAFTFIGANAFSGAAGEVRVQLVGSLYHVTADVNGDRIADLQITVNAAVAAGDFIF